MKSLVIGGAGFVGAYLVRHLQTLGHEVFVTKMQAETLELPGALVYDLDILGSGQVAALLRQIQPDYVFHLAAQSSVALSWKNPELTVDVNIRGCVQVLEAVRAQQVRPRVLLIGSGEEYGHILEKETPVAEDNRLRPGNIYAATKACQNMLGKIYADAYGMEVMMVRAFNHIGPDQSPVFVVADFCKQVAQIEAGEKEPVLRVGNLGAKRDFTDVRDVVRAYALLAARGHAGETYNVGSGHAVSIASVLQMIVAQSAADIRVETDAAKLRPVDVPLIEADTRKLFALTGWKPQIPLETTLRDTLAYWRGKFS